MIHTPATLSPKQLRSVREATGRVNVWEGSVRSGKTIASLLRFLLAIATLTTTGEIVVVSRTRDSAARNVFAPLQDRTLFGPIADTVIYSPGNPYGYILGRKVWVLGSSDRKAEATLRGLTCALAYVDEITLLQLDFFTQLLNRLWIGAQLFGTTNPDSPAHWLMERYLSRLTLLPDWRTWKFYLDDNPLLTEERKEAIRRENVGLFYRRNVLGEWVAGEGAIYDMWDNHLVIPWDDLPRMDRVLGVGIDYGTTNATAALMLGIGEHPTDEGRALYLMDEWRYDSAHQQQRLTDAQMVTQMTAWMDKPHHPRQEQLGHGHVIVDPSAASLRQELHVKGYPTEPADNDVLYGIRTMASLFGQRRLYVSSRCKGFIKEAPGYAWDPKATEKGEDKPMKVADHSLDGGRYAVTTTEALWRTALPI